MKSGVARREHLFAISNIKEMVTMEYRLRGMRNGNQIIVGLGQYRN
jgi:hypothetical protein